MYSLLSSIFSMIIDRPQTVQQQSRHICPGLGILWNEVSIFYDDGEGAHSSRHKEKQVSREIPERTSSWGENDAPTNPTFSIKYSFVKQQT